MVMMMTMVYLDDVLRDHFDKTLAARKLIVNDMLGVFAMQENEQGDGGADCKSRHGGRPFCYTEPGACADGMASSLLATSEYRCGRKRARTLFDKLAGCIS